jgi:predicted lactoylglutathione lyase
MMFLAVNCVDVAKSEEFYNKLGFVRQVSDPDVVSNVF